MGTPSSYQKQFWCDWYTSNGYTIDPECGLLADEYREDGDSIFDGQCLPFDSYFSHELYQLAAPPRCRKCNRWDGLRRCQWCEAVYYCSTDCEIADILPSLPEGATQCCDHPMDFERIFNNHSPGQLHSKSEWYKACRSYRTHPDGSPIWFANSLGPNSFSYCLHRESRSACRYTAVNTTPLKRRVQAMQPVDWSDYKSSERYIWFAMG